MFFYAAKLLWPLLQPSMVITLLVILGTLLSWRSRWPSLGRRLVVIGIALLLVCGLSPLGQWLAAPLENRFPRGDIARGAPVTGIIILGGVEDGRTSPPRELAGLNEAAERVTEAVALARQLPNARVVFSGGSGSLVLDEPPEAETIGRLLLALGLSPARVTLEDRSRDTWENALFTKRLIDPKPGERWLLVTSAWHMPRAIGCFRQAGFPVEAWPVDYRTPQSWTFERAIPDGLRRVDFSVREYLGLLVYYVTGRTSAFLPAP